MTKKSELKAGDDVICVSSKSNAYNVNSVYTVVQDKAGVLGLYGNDGLFDPFSSLLSQFVLKPKLMIAGVSK